MKKILIYLTLITLVTKAYAFPKMEDHKGYIKYLENGKISYCGNTNNMILCKDKDLCEYRGYDKESKCRISIIIDDDMLYSFACLSFEDGTFEFSDETSQCGDKLFIYEFVNGRIISVLNNEDYKGISILQSY